MDFLPWPFLTGALISADGEVTGGAYRDVMRSSSPRDNDSVFVWIEDDGRIVARGPDGVTKLWEARPSRVCPRQLPRDTSYTIPTGRAMSLFARAMILFAIESSFGTKALAKPCSRNSAGNRFFVLPKREIRSRL